MRKSTTVAIVIVTKETIKIKDGFLDIKILLPPTLQRSIP
jgi:hypothetical protein